jgi:carbonic anhydrase
MSEQNSNISAALDLSAPVPTLRELGADDTAELDQVRHFLRSYASWLGVAAFFHDLEVELATLPGSYAAPQGRLFYAQLGAKGIGFACIRPFAEGICELKRLYVDPAQSGRGVGRLLALTAIRTARQIGYRKILLETLPAMHIADGLYRDLGFIEATAYYPTATEGTRFLALDLDHWSDESASKQKLLHLFDFNRAWASEMQQADPEYFERLAHLQSPQYLWIGCSDSRVPANQIIGLLPGEVFVHRNVANVVVHTDLNCLSVIQFAIDVLKVGHIMVVGHYGCGGINAALHHQRVGLADIWLRHVQDVHVKHLDHIDALPAERRYDRLCELNVLEQVLNVSRTIVVQDAWQRGQSLTLHSWIYGLKDGLVRDLGLTVSAPEHVAERYEMALSTLN